MPGDPRKPCFLPVLKQQSTGQAGPEVNRDLEVLFAAVNQIGRCLSRVSSFLSSGGFDGGSGSAVGGGTSSGGPIPGDPGPGPTQPPFLFITSGDNTSVPEETSGDVFVDPSADIELTVTPRLGSRLRVFHVGSTYTVTVKDPGGTTLHSLEPTQMFEPVVFPTSAEEPEFAVGGLAQNKEGLLYTSKSIVYRDAAQGPVVKDATDGRFYRLEINSGSGAYQDEGATEPET